MAHARELKFTVRQTQQKKKYIQPFSKYVKDVLLSTKKANPLEMRNCNRRKLVRLEEAGKSKALLKKSSLS